MKIKIILLLLICNHKLTSLTPLFLLYKPLLFYHTCTKPFFLNFFGFCAFFVPRQYSTVPLTLLFGSSYLAFSNPTGEIHIDRPNEEKSHYLMVQQAKFLTGPIA